MALQQLIDRTRSVVLAGDNQFRISHFAEILLRSYQGKVIHSLSLREEFHGLIHLFYLHVFCTVKSAAK